MKHYRTEVHPARQRPAATQALPGGRESAPPDTPVDPYVQRVYAATAKRLRASFDPKNTALVTRIERFSSNHLPATAAQLPDRPETPMSHGPGRRPRNRRQGGRVVPSSALSLATGLARRCALYPSPIALAPRVLVIDVPAANRGGGLALGHYCPIILENPAEEAECEAFLRAPRADPMPPDLFDRRSSSGRSDEIVVTCFRPPALDWPWLSLCRWPAALARKARAQGVGMARRCYTMDLFKDENGLDAYHVGLLESLRARHATDVRLIAAV